MGVKLVQASLDSAFAPLHQPLSGAFSGERPRFSGDRELGASRSPEVFSFLALGCGARDDIACECPASAWRTLPCGSNEVIGSVSSHEAVAVNDEERMPARCTHHQHRLQPSTRSLGTEQNPAGPRLGRRSVSERHTSRNGRSRRLPTGVYENEQVRTFSS